MNGNAMLAMVASRACITATRQTTAEISIRRPSVIGGMESPKTCYCLSGTASAEPARKPPVTRIDIDDHTHAGAKYRPAGIRLLIDRDTHGNPLDDLDPIAGGILRRQQRELGTAGLSDAFDVAVENTVGI